MKGFRQFVLLSEAPTDAPAGAPMGGAGGAAGGMGAPTGMPGAGGAPPGMPPMGGGGSMGGMGGGMGMPPGGGMGGGMGGAPAAPQQPLKLKTYDVWDVLERILTGQKINDDKTGGKPKAMAPQPGMTPPTDPMAAAGGMGAPPMPGM